MCDRIIAAINPECDRILNKTSQDWFNACLCLGISPEFYNNHREISSICLLLLCAIACRYRLYRVESAFGRSVTLCCHQVTILICTRGLPLTFSSQEAKNITT
jgi:hypothetical protein